jgi:selenocysteine-specific elongation factor
MPIVGTAGHVDHGKSTLVEALTGTDPDRWAEEKERGLTIDLGFAWAQIGDHDVGFVDVPGHERFIKNMLAGVGAVDCALLVVAADSGWMPQTEEHAAVLDLLDAERGVIAITRIDLVDDDTVDLATLEVMEEVKGTGLEEWPIIPVSAITGHGLDTLRSEIASLLDDAGPREDHPMRMWIDRAFTVPGAGQIITGTVMEGTISVGDTLEIRPHGDRVKVRSLQHHGSDTESSAAGDRTAVNVSGATIDLGRGLLLATADAVDVTTRFLAWLEPTRAIDAIPRRGAFHVHIGTSSQPASIRRIGDSQGYLIQTEHAVAAIIGDRLIVRESGRRSVVGGGYILDTQPLARPTPSTVDLLDSSVRSNRSARADALVEIHGVRSEDQVRRATGGGAPTRAVETDSGWASVGELDRLAELSRGAASEYHAEHPTRPGLPKAELASRLDIDVGLLEVAVTRSSDVVDEQGVLRLASFSHALSDTESARWQGVKAQLEASFDVPRVSALDLDVETVHFLMRNGELVRIGDDLAFTKGQVAELNERVAELSDGFTVSDFKEHFGMARRQAVPTLEWLDSTGRTRRSGDGRVVRG